MTPHPIQRRPARLAILFTTLLFPVLGLILPRPAFADPSPRPAILKDLSAIIAPGLPGTVCALSKDAVVLVDAPAAKATRVPVIAAASFGKGRVIAFGHDGYFDPANLAQADTARLLRQTLAWATRNAPNPRLLTLNLPKLAADFKAHGDTAANLPITALDEPLPAAEALFLEAGALHSPAQAAFIARYVQQGGALFIAGTGWGWVQTHPGKTLAADFPANTLLAPMGLAFADAAIEKQKDKPAELALTPEVSPLLNAQTAYDLLLSTDKAPANLLKDQKTDLAQAAATLLHAAHAAPESAPLMKDLRKLQATRGNTLYPTPDKPLRPADAIARVLLTLQLRDLDNVPVDQIKPHPAAAAFPGSVPDNAPRITRSIPVDTTIPRWHSTGLYAAPGQIITITLPASAVDQKLRLRIGPHTDHTDHLPVWHRAPDISREIKLDTPATRFANPFGGLIYIVVPDRPASAASSAAATTPQSIDVRIANAVAAPLFVLGKTDPKLWRDQIRAAPAPWAEIATDKLIITLKSDAIRTLDDPTPILEHWNKVMDASATLAAWPLERKSPERMVSDIDISAGYMHSGYPIMTGMDVTNTFVDLKKLRSLDGWGFYHEIGHNHQSPDWTFAGTTEVTVNLFSMHTLETVCNLPPQESTRRALIDPAKRIKAYLAHPDFEAWKADPFLALAMYAQLRLEFGWAPYKQVFADYRALGPADRPKTEEAKHDQWMIRMSNATGKNLGPFFTAWGIPTSQAAKAAITKLPTWLPATMAAP